MKISRLLSAAGLAVAFGLLAAPGGAQPYPQGMAPQGYRSGDQGYGRPGYGGQRGRLPLFEVAQWTERETNWDGIWTFDMGAHRRTMSAVWTDRRTGRRQYARMMPVRREGQQIIITRPGLGNYVGTIQPGGEAIEGTMSWSPGRFRAHIRRQ